MFGVVLGWMLGCSASVVPQYEAARDAALADPGPPPANWQPDAVLAVAPEQVEAIVDPFLARYGKFEGKIERSVLGVTASATPKLTVTEVKLMPSKACESCLAVDAKLDGTLQWSALGQGGRVPVDGRVRFDGELAVNRAGDAFECTLTPRDVTKVDLDLGGLDGNVQSVLNSQILDWAKTQFKDQIPPIPVGSFGSDGVPLRAMKVIPTKGGGVQVRMLTRAKTPGVLDPSMISADQGFRLAIAPESVTGLARAAAFAAGPQSHDVVPEPTSFSIDGDQFALGLRLWKVSGRGWWRDYTVHGKISTGKRAVELKPGTVDEGPKSEGAAIADPLAFLGEGIILNAISDAVNTSLPRVKGTGFGEGVMGKVRIDEVRGANGALEVTGNLDLATAKAENKPRADKDDAGPRTPKPKPAGKPKAQRRQR